MSAVLHPAPLTKSGFAAFGEVVELGGAERFPINQGFAERFNNLAQVDIGDEEGSINISVISAQPRPAPIRLDVMERHPLGSQLFYPLQDRPWLVVVCGDPEDFASYRAFSARGKQGVNYARNAWHHPLLVFAPGGDFLVVDRKGPGKNLEEITLGSAQVIHLAG